MATYTYPVTNPFEARRVTEPEFEPDLFADDLYVDLDSVRGKEFRQNIAFDLSIDAGPTIRDSKLAYQSDDYVKIIFSGHRGCGKTTELKRLHDDLNDPSRYAAIYFSIEDETIYEGFQPTDLFVWIIVKLVQFLEVQGVRAGTTALDNLRRQLLTDVTIEDETKESTELELSTEVGGGFDFFGWLKFGTEAKAVMADNNQVSTKIREQVRQNTLPIIYQINAALVDIREAVRQQGKGEDLLFIIDGSEKLSFEVYEYLFLKNSHLIRELGLNLIAAVPIDAYYRIMDALVYFSNKYTIPMIKLANEHAVDCLKEIIRRRIDEPTFFEEGVLDECVRYSGGCVRQLLQIVNAVIRRTRGQKADMEAARQAIRELGRRMFELLDNQHLTILNSGNYQTGEAKVREMLFQLVLLKYDDDLTPNPLLEPFVTVTQPQS